MRASPRGFSLIEVMITLGIASGAMYVLMQVTQNHLKSQRMANTDAELSAVVQMIQSAMATPATCGGVVEHQPFSPDKTVATPIALSMPGGKPFGPGDSLLLPNWKIRGVYSRALDDGQVVSAEYKLYTASLEIVAARKSPGTSIGTELKTKTIPFTALVNTSTRKIAGCSMANSGPGGAGLLCAFLGGSFIDAKQRCETPQMNAIRCAALGGSFDSSGCKLKTQDSLQCHSLTGVYSSDSGDCQVVPPPEAEEGERRQCRIECAPTSLPMSVPCATDGLCLTSCEYGACYHQLSIPAAEDTVSGGTRLLGACAGAGVATNAAIQDEGGRPLCPPTRMCTATCQVSR